MEHAKSMKNIEIFSCIQELEGLLDKTGVLGYAIARNLRKLTEACTEYLNLRGRIFQKYGEPVLSDEGDPTGQLRVDLTKPETAAAILEMQEYDNIEHEVEIFSIPVEKAIDQLSARDILALDFMLDDNGAVLDDIAVK